MAPRGLCLKTQIPPTLEVVKEFGSPETKRMRKFCCLSGICDRFLFFHSFGNCWDVEF